MKLRNYLFLLVGALSFLSLSCSSDSSTGSVPISGESSSVELAERIISLSPTATEILFAIEAGDQVVAVDDQSNFPAEAPMTSLSGFTPNIESIAEYQPDLVVASYDPGDLVSGLEALDVTTVLQPAASSMEDTYSQINELGVLTGRQSEASELIERIKSRTAEMIKKGAVGEVRKFIKLKIANNKTANKAIGINEIKDYLNKKIEIDEVVEKISIKTRQYAKRQATWARGNMSDWNKIKSSSLNKFLKKI